jgi:multimeric flavodoxin WrbA
MKVLLINGSPHAHGTTYTALSEVAAELNSQDIQTEIFQIGTDPIYPCLGCRHAARTTMKNASGTATSSMYCSIK